MAGSNQPYQVMVISADAVSAAAVVGTFMGWLPSLAALGALLWYVVQIWESRTVQGWIRRYRQRHQSNARVLEKLVADREQERPRHVESPRGDY